MFEEAGVSLGLVTDPFSYATSLVWVCSNLGMGTEQCC